MSGGWLPKRIVFGNLEGAVGRGQGGNEQEWTDYIQSEILAFGGGLKSNDVGGRRES